MLQYRQLPVINANDLEDELNERGFEVNNIASILFDSDYMNDCYKMLSISKEEIIKYKNYYETIGLYDIRLAICDICQDAGITRNTVLIDVSW
jgi:hypothetical protein